MKKHILCINADLQSTNLGCAALGLSFVQVLREIAEKNNFHIEMSVLGYGKGKECPRLCGGHGGRQGRTFLAAEPSFKSETVAAAAGKSDAD